MINKLIQENLEKNIPEKDVAILLSGGVDSLSVAFACQNIGKNITAYSFKIKDVDNYDFNMAKEVSKILLIPFITTRRAFIFSFKWFCYFFKVFILFI